MRSLLLRIFLSFWLIIAVTIGIAAVAGYTYAERMRDAIENFEVSDTMIDASNALQSGGREGLATWLRKLPGSSPIRVYVLDQRGRDLLGRRLPAPVARAMRRFGDRSERPGAPRNIRPARPLTRLIGPDNQVYTFFVLPRRSEPGDWLLERSGLYILALAIAVSGFVSYLLARAISRPVRRFREATVAIAGGDLDTRVAESVGGRHDEIGHLARDFDRMTDELQRAWQQQTELTRNVSHELRSPLARLRVALELARREAGDLPEFGRIEAESERLDEMIGQILSYSRMDSRSDEQTEAVRLRDIIETVAEDVRYECRSDSRDSISIDVAVESDATISGYPTILASAIENVLRNAVRHSPPGGSVAISVQEEPLFGIVEIADQGSGVDEDELERIFEPFFCARQSAESGKKGSGLGLAIAQRAVRKHGGSITASNEPGGGLRVAIRLPTK